MSKKVQTYCFYRPVNHQTSDQSNRHEATALYQKTVKSCTSLDKKHYIPAMKQEVPTKGPLIRIMYSTHNM